MYDLDTMGKLRVLGGVAGVVVLLLACGDKGKDPAVPTTGPTTGEAFGGVQCSSVRPQTEPDLMAWDAGSRATLKSIKAQGVVVVRYEAKGCDVSLHVLPNCKAKGKYVFEPYSAKETKLARSANELFAELPVGAAKLSGKLRGTRAIRTDYMMAGVESVEIGTTFKREELVGDCGDATHVVSKIYVGGFGLAAGESKDLEGGASVFAIPGVGAIGGGAKHESAVEHLQHEGVAEACEEAQKKGLASGQCSVPLRVALMSLGEVKMACPEGATWDGTQCVRKNVVTEVTCPAGTKWNGTQCAASVSTSCAAGLHFEAGRGCMPDQAAVVTPPSGGAATSRVEGGMVAIPAGDFMMGSDDYEDEKPVLRVHVNGFSMDVTEVTVSAYQACVSAGGCAPAPTTVDWSGITEQGRSKYSGYCNGGKSEKGNHPINCVSWDQATAYCGWAKKRLPTEEEWEYAARGTEGRKYPWGGEAPASQLCWQREASGQGTCAVGSYPAGRSPFGLQDMAGNVSEWTSSLYSENYSKNRTGPARVSRGGGWFHVGLSNVRGADRRRNAPSDRSFDLGFRCAR